MLKKNSESYEELLHNSLRKNNGIYFRRKGWNEEWTWTKDPIWDFSIFEYKTVEDLINERIKGS